jgi:hypothetical protein
MKFVEMVKGLFNKKAQVMTSVGVMEVENQTLSTQTPLEIGKMIFEEEAKKVEPTRLISVSNHRYQREQRKYYHSATIKVEGTFINIKSVIGETAIQCGYHPAGYSCWNEVFKVVDLEKGIYDVCWTSYDTCD